MSRWNFYPVIACFCFLAGCGLDALLMEYPEGLGADYLEQRKMFETKLTTAGPSPQDYEQDKPLNNVRTVWYRSWNLKLKAWLYVPDGDESKKYPALVYCHGGFAGDAEEVLSPEPFIRGGYVVMAPTFRGENGNPGNFEMMFGEVDDAVNAARWLAEQPFVDADHIYMFGHSIGGAISSLVSLMDDVPVRITGGSGGLYGRVFFNLGWNKDWAPFSYRDEMEKSMRLLEGNTDSMLRPHYSYLGQSDFKEFHQVARKYVSGKIKAPLLHIETIPGDHFTSFDEAARRYFDVVEKDRAGVVVRGASVAHSSRYDLSATYQDRQHGFRFKYDPEWVRQDRNGITFLVADQEGFGEAAFSVNVGDHDPTLLKTTRREMERIIKQAAPQGRLLDFRLTKFQGIDCMYYGHSSATDKGIRIRHVCYAFNLDNNAGRCNVSYWALDDKFGEYSPVFEEVIKTFQLP